MKLQHPLFLLSLAAVIFAASGMINSFAQSGGNAKAVSAAVVDVDNVFQGLAEREQIEARITSQIEKLQEKEQAKRQEIKDIQTELGVLSPDSPEYDKRRQDMEHLVIELQVELQYQQRQIEIEKALQIENLYRKILLNIEEIAQQRGYDLVLFKDQTPSLRGANQQQLAAMIQVRKLLYSAPSLDITETVKQRMNARHTATGGN